MSGKRFNFPAIITALCLCIVGSICDSEKLLRAEEEIIKALSTYLSNKEEILSKITRMKALYESVHALASRDTESFLENPFNHYLLMKRLTIDFKTLKELVISNNGQEFLDDIESTKASLKWPRKNDLLDAQNSLFFLQQAYGLDAVDISRGTAVDSNLSIAFNDDDCEKLADWAFENEQFQLAKIWMREALRRTLEDPKRRRNIIQKYLYSDLLVNSDVKGDALFWAADLIELEIFETIKKSGNISNLNNKQDDFSELRKVFYRLCQGENIRKPLEEARLHCHQQVRGDPYLLIQRIKEEELNLNPRILLYHDILSDREIRTLQKLATPKLVVAALRYGKDGARIDTSVRACKAAVLEDNEHEIFDGFNRRVTSITGLTTEGSEKLWVGEYRPGGHIIPHYDYTFNRMDTENRERTNDRIATWLNYMNDVEAGGATVFPLLGISIRPEKGSALFWHNLKRSGRGDIDTFHGGCPVLVGSKWVSNKWLREFGQEFRRQCSLDSRE